MAPTTAQRTAVEHPLGLPWWGLGALALLAAPRVVLHDLGVGTEGPVAGLLAIGPAVVWVAVVVWARVRRPLTALLVVGLGYGLILALVHNVLWHEVFDDVAPSLGGNLEGRLPGAAEELVLRVAMSISSISTGVAVGLVCGVVALGIQSLTARRPGRR